jgi:3-oxoacyl-[acyl-carrier-protein] synthase-3
MIFADGSAAMILEGRSAVENGILSHKTKTYASQSHLLRMDSSNSDFTDDQKDIFLKMNGRKVYEFALTNVPLVIKEVIESAGLHLSDIKKVLVHQANDKMDQAILERLFKLYNQSEIPHNIMPMTIAWLGNSSVATVPTLLDLICRNQLAGHVFRQGDHIIMASVGAGMNINALVYKY